MINDHIRDNGVNAVDTDADALHICSQDPTTYAEATSTYTLGVKTSPTINAPADGTGSGRSVTMQAFSDGTTTGNGDATHWALVDTINSRLLATGPITEAPVAITTGAGETFSFGTLEAVRIPD